MDILRQKQLLEASRQQVYQMESNIRILEHQLIVLLGYPPQQNLQYAPDSLPQLASLPATGLPADLIQRRPDVQRDFHLLKAADREVASAISAQYPRITITASVASRSNTADALFREWAYSLGANIVAPIFYGGRLSAEVDRTKAVKQQRLYEYGQTVLTAFREVEDALIQERMQRQALKALKEQVHLSKQAYEQLRMEYFNGMRDYLAVLTALNELQQLQRDLITAKFRLLQFRISLYRSLAGGFEMAVEVRDEPSEDEQE